jgi:hypothetical protein
MTIFQGTLNFITDSMISIHSDVLFLIKTYIMSEVHHSVCSLGLMAQCSHEIANSAPFSKIPICSKIANSAPFSKIPICSNIPICHKAS